MRRYIGDAVTLEMLYKIAQRSLENGNEGLVTAQAIIALIEDNEKDIKREEAKDEQADLCDGGVRLG